MEAGSQLASRFASATLRRRTPWRSALSAHNSRRAPALRVTLPTAQRVRAYRAALDDGVRMVPDSNQKEVPALAAVRTSANIPLLTQTQTSLSGQRRRRWLAVPVHFVSLEAGSRSTALAFALLTALATMPVGSQERRWSSKQAHSTASERGP